MNPTLEPPSQSPPLLSLSREQYEAVFRETYWRYYYLSLHVVSDGEAARDIVSEVFVELWRRRLEVDPQTVESYLYRCVRNASIDYLRRQQRTTSIDRALGQRLENLADDGDSWRDQDERIERMMAVVEQLPERTREVIRQRYGQGRSYKEVAQEMSITTDGVKAHVVKALKLLRKNVEQWLL